jgi:aminopeptidase N
MRTIMVAWAGLILGGSALPAWRTRYVELHIAVDPGTRSLEGFVRLALTSAAGASELLLDFSDSLALDSVRALQPTVAIAAATHAGNRIRVTFERPLPRGQYEVGVWYHGHPARKAVGMSGNRIATYGLPNSAREWWPVLDAPDQKADSADLWLSAPRELTAVSIGRLQGTVTSADGRTATTHWVERHPVYPDAIAFAVGDYAVLRSTATLPGGERTAVAFYLFPEDSAKGATDFADAAGMLAFYAERLGPYPFADEKYALVEFARPSFREAQTLSHIGAGLLTGHQDAEQVVAHEVAHQWFGNALTVKSWADIWLNESLSEYMAWQWIRHQRGDTAYEALLDSARVAPVPGPVVPANPADFRTLFGNGTFQRGPAMLVLLEREIGRKAFDRALRAYVKAGRYGLVDTEAFQRACERAAGRSLDAFFSRWLRGTDPLPPVF